MRVLRIGRAPCAGNGLLRIHVPNALSRGHLVALLRPAGHAAIHENKAVFAVSGRSIARNQIVRPDRSADES